MSEPRWIAMLGTDVKAPGGISSVLTRYRESSLNQRWPIRFISTWEHAATASRIACAARAAAQLWSLQAAGRLQGVHAHVAARGSFWRKRALLQPLWSSGLPVILHVHDGRFVQWWTELPRLARHEVVRTLGRSARVIALDSNWKAQLQELAPRAAVTVLPNPVTLHSPSPTPHAGRILFLSRLWASKGVDDLLQACARLDESLDYELVCAGDGDEHAVRARADQLGIGHRVTLSGWLEGEQKMNALQQAQVMVMPSHAEGQPMAVLEAMASGVPVVATAVGGLPHLLGQGAGVLVRPHQPEALAQALTELLSDPLRCRAMGACGRAQVEQDHSSESVAMRLSQMYRELGWRDRKGAS